MNKFGIAAVLSMAFAATGQNADAQSYPNRSIRLVVPIAAGSVTDVAARLMAQELSSHLGGNAVIVENKPGASMVIGGAECAKSPPDGYTLCVVSPDTMSYNPYTVPNLPYDPDRDFRPVTNMYYVVEGLIVKQAVPANSIADLHKLASQPGSALNFGTLGGGTVTDMYRLWLNDTWKTNIVGVPYKGGSEIVSALLGGTIDVSKIGMGNIGGQLSDGKIKVLAVRSSKRNELLPDVPTLDEAGLGGFPGGPIFWGVVAPRATPDAIVAKLHKELTEILRSPKFTEFAKKQFLEIDANSPEQFAAFLKQDRENAGKVIKAYAGKQ